MSGCSSIDGVVILEDVRGAEITPLVDTARPGRVLFNRMG